MKKIKIHIQPTYQKYRGNINTFLDIPEVSEMLHGDSHMHYILGSYGMMLHSKIRVNKKNKESKSKVQGV